MKTDGVVSECEWECRNRVVFMVLRKRGWESVVEVLEFGFHGVWRLLGLNRFSSIRRLFSRESVHVGRILYGMLVVLVFLFGRVD